MSDLSACYIMPARRSLYKLTLRSTIVYSINTIKHKELNLLISFFAPFFANGMALPNQAITLQESKTDFFNCTSCKWNVKTKLYKSSELSTKWNMQRAVFFSETFASLLFGPRDQCFVNDTASYLWYFLNIRSFDIFYLFDRCYQRTVVIFPSWSSTSCLEIWHSCLRREFF